MTHCQRISSACTMPVRTRISAWIRCTFSKAYLLLNLHTLVHVGDGNLAVHTHLLHVYIPDDKLQKRATYHRLCITLLRNAANLAFGNQLLHSPHAQCVLFLDPSLLSPVNLCFLLHKSTIDCCVVPRSRSSLARAANNIVVSFLAMPRCHRVSAVHMSSHFAKGRSPDDLFAAS